MSSRALPNSLGLRFAERPDQNTRKQPVREIVGVHPALNIRWSARRAAIEARRSVLAAEFQRAHGRPPTPVEALQLAQRANLETREPKHQPRSVAEQREAWFTQAAEVLGGPDAVRATVRDALSPSASAAWELDADWLDAAADRVLAATRSAVPPGRSGMYAPRRNAKSKPPTCRQRRLTSSLTCSSTKC
jgi:hypothetical protein